MPKLSVIIPVYNAQEYLRRCLDSVINQTLKDIEIICVNDCSTDSSLQILEEYALKHKNLKVIDCKVNGGESVARNIGLENVAGEYLAFVDNDDAIDLDFFEKLYNKAKAEDADIARGEAHYVSYDGKSFINKDHIKRTARNKFYFSNDWWCGIFKTSLIKKHEIKLLPGFYISSDVIFLIKAVTYANRVATVADVYYHHYDRENSGFSKFLTKEKILSGVKAVQIVLNFLNQEYLYDKDTEGYDWLFEEQFRILLNLHYHNNDASLVYLYSDAMIKLYNCCERAENLYSFLEKDFPCIAHFIKNENYRELSMFLTCYMTQIKFLSENLRANLKKRK